MLVDNHNTQSHFPPPPSMSMYQGYTAEPEISDFFDTELFNSNFTGSAHSSSPSGSRESTPQSLMTPPQEVAPTSFPDVHDGGDEQPLFANYDDPLKGLGLSMASTSLFNFDGSFGNGLPSFGMDMGLGMNFGMGMTMSEPMFTTGINPSQIDTPPPSGEQAEEESPEAATESPAAAPEPTAEKPTIVIAPVKAAGHGKARKGTVQSGGVVKKTTGSLHKEKETPSSSFASSSRKTSQNPVISTALFTTSLPSPHTSNSSKAESEAGDDDDDDLPHDWRPSPEVFAKMTSKEKRQLRNKISARNFRVRRKEYISTLEGDIAERDRMLDHYRSQLSSHESENIALRQEIAALKKALLEGRGGTVHLPPPAPLPEQSAAEQLAAAAAASASQSSAPLLTANTQKDLPMSPRLGGSANRFWGGVAGASFTPVHTTLVPDITNVVGRKALQENMNPAMNAQSATPAHAVSKPLPGFDGFADLNPFTMKTLDAYRMHLWGKMASQQHAHQQHLQQMQQQQAPGLSAGLRPHYFAGASKQAASISAVLASKHAYPSPPATPLLTTKGLASSNKEREIQQQQEKAQQQAMLAAMASQTVFRKLGSAFWEAFSGSSPSSSHSAAQNWDQEKVQRVLEGKAVLQVVDVEPPTPKVSPKSRPIMAASRSQDDAKSCHLTDILEESMRCLTLAKKV